MIDFSPLGAAMASAFDCDHIVSITDITGKVRMKDLPCHLVITSNDNPTIGTTSGAAILPISFFAEVYTGQDVVILEGDEVVVEKRDTTGNVLTTYTGKSGVPSVRQGRKVASLQITKVEQVSPLPPSKKFFIRMPDGRGGYFISANSYLGFVDAVDDDIAAGFYFTDPAFRITDGPKVYLNDPKFYGEREITGGKIRFAADDPTGLPKYVTLNGVTPAQDSKGVYIKINAV